MTGDRPPPASADSASTDPASAEPAGEATEGQRLWPSPEYARQVERLRAAVGATVYIAEIEATAVQLGVRITDTPYVLLGVLDFPRPDPVRGLAPHLILLDDGRGVNLGRIARLSIGRAFAPAPGQVLFQDREALETLLFQERRLSPQRIAQSARALLGEVLGRTTRTTERLPAAPEAGAERDGAGLAGDRSGTWPRPDGD